MSQNKQVGKIVQHKTKKKIANRAKESKRKTPQTQGDNDKEKSHAKGKNKRGNTRRENIR